MSFKKTADGRIFFKGANDESDSVSVEETQEIRTSEANSQPKTGASDPAQIQILALLRSLNERLKDSQLERDGFRQDLKIYQQMIERASHQAEEARDDSVSLRALHQEQTQRLAQTIADYAELRSRLKATEEQQSEITAQIGRAFEERGRFLEKVERIEQALLQATPSTQAGAFLLMNPQAKEQGPGVFPHALSAMPYAMDTTVNTPSETGSFWHKKISFHPITVLGLMVGVLLAGWGLSQIQKPAFQDNLWGDSTPVSALPADSAAVQAPIEMTPQQPDFSAIVPEPSSVSDLQQTSPEKQTLSAPKLAPSVDDIGAVDLNDDSALLDLLNTDEKKLGAELNKIEPGNEAQKVAASQLESGKENPGKAPAPAPSKPCAQSFMKPDERLGADIRPVESKAMQGVPEAQHGLAALYTAGRGDLKPDYERAAFWFQKAADQGVPNAAYNLGVLYHRGLGIKEDMAQAVHWYETAANLGHPEAQYNLGIAYIEGVGVPYDPQKANTYSEKAATQGVVEAAYNLGLIQENGLLGEANPRVALTWYKKAADQGNPEAKAALDQLAKSLGLSIEDVNRLENSAQKESAISSKASVVRTNQ